MSLTCESQIAKMPKQVGEICSDPDQNQFLPSSPHTAIFQFVQVGPHLVINGVTSSLQMALEMGNLAYSPYKRRYFTMEFCNPLYYWFLGVPTLQVLCKILYPKCKVWQMWGGIPGSVVTVKYIESYRLQSKQNTAEVCFETTFVSSLRGPISTKKHRWVVCFGIKLVVFFFSTHVCCVRFFCCGCC